VLAPQVSYVLAKLVALRWRPKRIYGKAACRRHAKRTTRKSKRASNAPKRRYPQRENSASGHSRAVLLCLEREIHAKKGSWHWLTHNRRARAAPPRLEIPNFSHGPSRRRLLKDFRGVFEGLPHAPGERDSNRRPSQERLGIEAAPADSIGTLRANSLAARRGFYADFFLYMPLGVNRPDQRIANESGDQEAGKNEGFTDRSARPVARLGENPQGNTRSLLASIELAVSVLFVFTG
jgi:hypothetical protein